jgi:NAD-dependent DNA ligase adenylation domain
MRELQLLEAAHPELVTPESPTQRVELLVGNLGRALDVVQLVVPPDLAAEGGDALVGRERHGGPLRPLQRSRVMT